MSATIWPDDPRLADVHRLIAEHPYGLMTVQVAGLLDLSLAQAARLMAAAGRYGLAATWRISGREHVWISRELHRLALQDRPSRTNTATLARAESEDDGRDGRDFIHRVVPAATAPRLAVRAPRSVFELAEVA